jgi:uncharacterized repeat protein (TIGR01451 family)
VVYTVTVTNLGPDDAVNVALTDELPLSPRVSTAVTAVPSQGTCDTTIPRTVFCELGAIAKDESATVTITITTIRSGQPEEIITNRAFASDGLNTNDPDNSPGHENEATEETTIQPGAPLADLEVIKSDSADPVIAGERLLYTIQVINHGPDDATNVVLTDGFDFDHLSFIQPGQPSQGSCDPFVGSILTCRLGTIASGENATLTVLVRTSDEGTLTNLARVSSDVEDPNTTGPGSQNEVTEETEVKPGADLVVTKTDSPDPVAPGSNVVYTVTVTNLGPDDATNVVLEDGLPDDATLVPPIVSSQGACTLPVGGVMTCLLGDIAKNNSATVTITMKTDENFEGTLSNSAEVSSDVDDPFTAGAGHENITIEDTTVRLNGDVDNDGDVDRDDVRIILLNRNQPASVCPECDLDDDGVITVRDAMKAIPSCSRPRCARE